MLLKEPAKELEFVLDKVLFIKIIYFFYIIFFFDRGYCSNLKPREYIRKIKNIDKNYYGIEFNTYTFRSFNWIYNIFYKKGKKVLHLINNDIAKYISPLTLAIWICDDGGFAKPGLRIACNAFSLKEVKYLSNILKIKFNLDNTIQKLGSKDQYSIYIRSNSMPILRKIIMPHMPISMIYKLGINYNQI